MAELQEPGERGAIVTVAARLAGRSLALGAAALVLALLSATGQASWFAGLVAFAAILAVAGLPPRAARREAPPAADPPAVGEHAAGVFHFAASLPDPCFVLDRRGVVRFANLRAAAAFSIRVGDELTFRMRAPDLIAAFHRVARGGEPERVDFAERVPTERWFAAWFAGLDPPAPGAPPALIVLVLDDLSERRRAERIKIDFVANASHELRTPLASLAGFIETLQGPARDDAKARERFLAVMHDQATRMSRLIDDLLSLSRIEMKAHVRPSGQVELVGLLRHVIDALEPLARELGVTIEPALPAAAVTIRGDQDELVQVFENLVENACKYGQSGKRVAVLLTQDEKGGGAIATVRDFGPGIPPEHLPRLTERFYRVDADASRRHRGTGLGLAIVKHIVNRHQARLGIDSPPGEGARFSVAFRQAEWSPLPAPIRNDLELQAHTPS